MSAFIFTIHVDLMTFFDKNSGLRYGRRSESKLKSMLKVLRTLSSKSRKECSVGILLLQGTQAQRTIDKYSAQLFFSM